MNIISVDYRLSPEYKFPTPIYDAIDAWNYIHDNHKALNIHPKYIGVGWRQCRRVSRLFNWTQYITNTAAGAEQSNTAISVFYCIPCWTCKA